MIVEKKEWISNLRVIATVSVVVLHVSCRYLDNQFIDIPGKNWWVGNLFDSITRFCVPVFLMITGALLLSQKNDFKTFFTKRTKKLLPLFIFWSIIYIIQYIVRDVNSEIYNIGDILSIIINKLLNGAEFHLWYIYLIIGLYLLIPLLSKWINNSSEKEIRYFLFIWIITVCLQQFDFFRNYFPAIELMYFSGYIGFLILGYYLAELKIPVILIKKMKYLAVILYCVGFLITFLGTAYLTIKNNKFQHGFYEYLTLNVIIASIGIFLFFKLLTIKKHFNFLIKIRDFIDKHSYGIYLSHIFILCFLEFSYSIIPIAFINIPIMSLLCIIASALLTWGISIIPFKGFKLN